MKIQTEPFRKVSDGTAAEICGRVDLSAEARAFLVPGLSPQGYLALLVDAMEEAARPEIRSQPVEGEVLAALRAQLARPAARYAYVPSAVRH